MSLSKITSATEVHLAVGQLLYSEGDLAEFAYILEAGELVLYHDCDGKRVDLERRGPGSIIGELSILTEQPRAVGVVATTPCILHQISASQIKQRFDKIDPILKACVDTSIRFVGRINEKRNPLEVPLAEDSSHNTQSLIEQFRFEQDMLQAIDAKNFYMNYQPLIDLKTNAIIGFESLMRWQHPTKGFIPPDVFITIAEKTDLISGLTDFAIMETCAILQDIDRRFPKNETLIGAVNISGKDLERANLADFIMHAVDLHCIKPEQIRLEITETALAPNDDVARNTMRRLRDLGFGIAIDDFGTGYSNLAYLKEIPLTAIKIDRAFVGDACANKTSLAIVDMVVQLGHALGARVVGEGVETQEDLDVLARLNCDLAQGYLFSKPVGRDAFLELLSPESTPNRSVA